jgi:hypothetical protein
MAWLGWLSEGGLTMTRGPGQPLGMLDMPGRAGEIQRQGTVEELVAELGANYSYYHEFLAQRLDALDGRARPEAFGADYAGYLQACQDRVDLVRAEAWLRWCKSHVRGRAPARSPPLFDERGRLVAED